MGELEELIRQLTERIVRSVVMKAVQVGTATDVTDTICKVTREGAPDLLDVNLNAIEGDLESFVTIVPKEGSTVLVAMIENKPQEAFIVQCSEVDKVIWKCGETKLVFDKEGYKISRGDETLKKLIEDLIKEVLKLTVTTSTGPSGTPINAAAFQAIQQRLTDLFSG